MRNTIDLLAPPPHVAVELLTPMRPCGVSCQHESNEWHFSGADNGPGIEGRHFERIFQLFRTLNSRDDLERTGVGLALVKKIVELEGGRPWVESTVGSGTTFHFTLAAGEELPS